MNDYPEVVTKIVDDYLRRLKSQLRMVPTPDQDEFLREIHSHLYEAYQHEPGEDDVVRILVVLRKLGEPAEVVSDRLPQAMVRSGTKRNQPLYVIGGILIALFGIPLGFGAMAVLVGLLGALTGAVVAYYVTAGSMLLVGAISMLLGVTRISQPELWDRLVMLGVINVGGRAGDFFDLLAPSGQGFLMIVFASAFVASGLGMLWLGKYLFRGLRFLFGLVFDWIRQLAHSARRVVRREQGEALRFSRVAE